MKFPFVDSTDGMIVMIASLSLCSFYTLLIVAQMINTACGMPAKASNRALKYIRGRQETPDSGEAEISEYQ